MRKVTKVLLILLAIVIVGVVVADRVGLEIDKIQHQYCIEVEDKGTFFSDLQPMVDSTGVGFVDAHDGLFKVFNGYPYNITAQPNLPSQTQPDHN